MPLNIIDATKALFNTQLINEASKFLGESETAVSKAVAAAISAILNGLINKAATIEGAGAIVQMINNQHSSWILSNLDSFFKEDGTRLLNKSAGLLRGIFDYKLESTIGLIANFCSINTSSSASLLSAVLPATLATISKHNNNNSVIAVATLLNTQKSNVTMAEPLGLNLHHILGHLGGTGSIAAALKPTNGISYKRIEKTDKILKVVLPLFLIIAGAMLVFYFAQSCNSIGKTAAATDSIELKKNR